MNFLVHSTPATLSRLWDETDGASIVVKEMKKNMAFSLQVSRFYSRLNSFAYTLFPGMCGSSIGSILESTLIQSKAENYSVHTLRYQYLSNRWWITVFRLYHY